MKLSPSGGLILSITVLAAAVAWWLWPRVEANPEGGSKPTTTAVERSSLPVAANPAGKPLPEWGSPEFNKMILERCAKWMESRGRDGASLVAMWDLAGEESLLLEAAEKFPDDPRVCAAMIGHLTAKGGDALPWAERLIANEPNNPAGHYWKATLLANAGKPEEALEALRAGTKVKGTPDQHLRERMVTAREAVLASGGGAKEAAQAALAGPFSKTGLPVLGGKISTALRAAINEAKASGDEDRLVEAAGMGAAAAEHMRSADAPSLMNDLVMQGALLMALTELPPETDYGNDGKTAGERLAELEAERAQTRELMGSHKQWDKFMAGLTDSQASEYTDRVILHGERAAMQWLIDTVKKSPAEN